MSSGAKKPIAPSERSGIWDALPSANEGIDHLQGDPQPSRSPDPARPQQDREHRALSRDRRGGRACACREHRDLTPRLLAPARGRYHSACEHASVRGMDGNGQFRRNQTFWIAAPILLERFPIRWNHLMARKSRKTNNLERAVRCNRTANRSSASTSAKILTFFEPSRYKNVYENIYSIFLI
jgi:hypothetical protein